jgi:hypothetical protein
MVTFLADVHIVPVDLSLRYRNVAPDGAARARLGTTSPTAGHWHPGVEAMQQSPRERLHERIDQQTADCREIRTG